MKALKNIARIFLLSPLLLFNLAHAQTIIDTPQGVIDLITKIGNWAYGILLGLAVIFIVVAGYIYLFSGGDTEKTEKAKKQIIYAVVAVSVAILANGIIAITQSILTK